MAGRCTQCSQPTEWAPDVGSDVCTSCGTLADPSQSVLTSHIDFPNDASTRDYPSLPYTRPTALKSLRGTAGWLLAGQGKEATHDRNKIALHESIRTLAARLAHPGIAPRAQALFDLALHRASLRWGRPAKLAAGAAVLFALREAGCPDATPDLATRSRNAPASGAPRACLVLPRRVPRRVIPHEAARLPPPLTAPPLVPARVPTRMPRPLGNEQPTRARALERAHRRENRARAPLASRFASPERVPERGDKLPACLRTNRQTDSHRPGTARAGSGVWRFPLALLLLRFSTPHCAFARPAKNSTPTRCGSLPASTTVICAP